MADSPDAGRSARPAPSGAIIDQRSGACKTLEAGGPRGVADAGKKIKGRQDAHALVDNRDARRWPRAPRRIRRVGQDRDGGWAAASEAVVAARFRTIEKVFARQRLNRLASKVATASHDRRRDRAQNAPITVGFASSMTGAVPCHGSWSASSPGSQPQLGELVKSD